MAVNKVVYGTTTLVDLTEDTVQADKLLEGYTAHDSSGNLVTGTLVDGESEKTVTLNVTNKWKYYSGKSATICVYDSTGIPFLEGGEISSIISAGIRTFTVKGSMIALGYSLYNGTIVGTGLPTSGCILLGRLPGIYIGDFSTSTYNTAIVCMEFYKLTSDKVTITLDAAYY